MILSIKLPLYLIHQFPFLIVFNLLIFIPNKQYSEIIYNCSPVTKMHWKEEHPGFISIISSL